MNKSSIIIAFLLTAATFYGVTKVQKSGYSFRHHDNDHHDHHHHSDSDMNEIQSDWLDYQTKCGKQYSSEEKYKRFIQFLKNRQAIMNHNDQSGESYTLGINCAADLDSTEHSYRVQLGTKLQQDRANIRFIFGTESLPTEVDWRKQNAVSDIKNQGQCGSCWAFSTVGALEGLNAIKNGKIETFSEQQLVDCAGGDYGNQGCNGGLMDLGFNYTQINGIATEANYPYKGTDGKCSYSAGQKVFQNTGFIDVPQNQTEQMKIAIARQPVSVAIDASSLGFQFYKSGVYTGKGLFSACGTGLDHGVLVVGYGSDNGKDYYLVKNSWGSSWGMSGYIQMAQDGNGPGTCGIQMQASYPTL